MKKITFWILAFLGCLQMQAQIFTTDICSGTLGSSTYGPMYSTATANATNRTAVVYQSSNLTMLAGQTLTSAYFRRTTATGTMAGTPNFKIYLKEVTFTDFGSGSLDWATATTGAVLVYDNNPASAAGSSAGWKSFPLTTNFLYSGTQNLAVFMEYTNPTASSTITWFYEYGSPCIDTNNSNTTKYLNNTSGTLPALLTSTDYRRPQIGFDFLVSCPAPTSLIVSDITASSASFDWNPGLNETQWDYAILPAGSGIPTTTTSISASELINAPLDPATSYQMYVRSSCGTEDKSFWVVSDVFTTQCVDVTSFVEHFDTYTTGTTSMPTCWEKIGTGTAYVTTGGVSPGSTPNRFYMNTGATTFIHAILPSVTNLSANTHRLKFKAYASTVGKMLEVGYQTDLLDATTFVLLESIDLPSTTAALAEEFVVEPFGVPTNVKNLVFRSANGTATSIYIDDVVWETTPSCADVTGLNYSSLLDTSIIVNWLAGGVESAWQYAYGDSELLDPSTLTPVDVTSGMPTATISNLTPFTAYKIWVRSNCLAGGFGAWIGPLLFKTQCTAVTTFTENFDSSATGSTAAFTDCWQKAGNGAVYVTTGGVLPGTAPNRLYMTANATATSPTESFAIMPLISNLQANTHRLKFKAYCSTADKTIDVGYLSNINDLTSFIGLDQFELPGTTGPTALEFTTEPFGVPAGIGNLVFRNSGTAGSTTVYIDDVIWEQTPTCSDVSSVNYSTLLDTSVTVNWFAGGSETAWQYAYGDSTLDEPSTLTPVDVSDTPTANITGLTASTSYKIWVRSNCTPGGFGAWIGPLLLKTQCAPVTDFYENFDSSTSGSTAPFTDCWQKAGNGSVYVTTGGADPGTPPNRLYMSANGTANTPTEAFAMMPMVSNLQAETHRLKFKAYASTANKTIEVGFLSNLTDLTSFTSLEQFDLPGTTAATAVEFISEPFGIPVGVNNLVFRNGAATGSTTIYIDDVVWEPIPACSDLTVINVTTFNSTSASFTWEPGGSESAWQYVYAESTVTDPTTLTANIVNVTNNPTAAITGLNPATSYNVWIRTKCGTNVFGNWPQNPLMITTTCAPVTEFSQNFDSSPTGTTSVMPTCWTKFGTTGTTYVTTGSSTPNSAPNRLYLNASATTPTTAIAVLPPVSNLQAETHRLKFKAYASTAGKEIEIGYYENAGMLDSFTLLQSIPLPSTTQTTTEELIYIPTFVPAGVESLVFRNNAGAFSGTTAIYIDDVIWESIPACADILEAQANVLSSTTTDLSWNPGDSETAWQYVYAVSTVTDPNTLTPIDVTTTPVVSLTMLMPNTNYNYWIRSNCGTAGLGNWSAVFTFKTDCESTVAFTENFDSYATGSANPLPDCWTKGGTALVYIATGGALPGTPPNRLYMTASGTTGTQSLAIMPSLSNLQAGTHRLKFKAYATTVDRFVEVGYLTDNNDVSTFEVLSSFDLPGTSAATAASFSYIPTNIPVGVTRLAFRNIGIVGGITTLYIDDVVWELSPNCPDVSQVGYSGVTSTTANINWVLGGSETAWEYVYGLDTVTDPNTLTPVPVSTNPEATLSNLLPSTTYKVWVRSVCGTDLGAWSSPATFTTQCSSSPTPFNENFSSFLPNCWATSSAGTIATGPTASSGGFWLEDGFLNNGLTGAARVNIYSTNRTSWLITPSIDASAPGQYTFSFEYGITAYTGTAALNMGSDDTIQIAMSLDAGVTWTEIQLFNSSTSISNLTNTYSYGFAANALPVKFAIVANDGTVNDLEDYNFYADNFKVEIDLSNTSFDNATFTAYPNPVKDMLNLTSIQNISEVSVFNLLGQQVTVSNINATKGQVDMSHLATGTYLVKVITEVGTKTIKVIKE